jgi:hypothetical protein
MGFNIAVQVFGQLRMWENPTYYIDFFNFLKTQADSVDIFGTFWDDEYSKEKLEGNKFDFFTETELIPIPETIYKGLWRWGYCLLKSRNFRKKYQFKNKKNYDLVIMMRPDLRIKIGEQKTLSQFLNTIKNKQMIYRIWFQKEISNSSIKPFDVDDKVFYATEETADLFCLGFNHLHNNIDSPFHSAYHTDPICYVKMFNLIVSPFNLTANFANFDLIRHHYLKDINLTTEPQYDEELKKVRTLDEVKNLVKKHLDE